MEPCELCICEQVCDTSLACADGLGSEAVLAGGTENGTIILWNFLTGRSLSVLPGCAYESRERPCPSASRGKGAATFREHRRVCENLALDVW